MADLLIRADANAEMGTGHVMRCIALAEAWAGQGGGIVFSAACDIPSLRERMATDGATLAEPEATDGGADDAADLVDLARRRAAEWVVIDGYHFDAAYRRAIKDAGLRVLVLDDYGHAARCWADIVLNQNAHAALDLYPDQNSDALFLLGTRFALLRSEFLRASPSRETPIEARRLLVTLGGSDPAGMTEKVVRALHQAGLPELEAKVVVGPGNARAREIEEMAAESRGGIEVLRDVADMPGLITWADIALSAAGSTCWELAFLGVPTLLVATAENQRANARALAANGTMVNLGWHADLDPSDIVRQVQDAALSKERREAMRAAGRHAVDGRGAGRVVRAMKGRL